MCITKKSLQLPWLCSCTNFHIPGTYLGVTGGRSDADCVDCDVGKYCNQQGKFGGEAILFRFNVDIAN